MSPSGRGPNKVGKRYKDLRLFVACPNMDFIVLPPFGTRTIRVYSNFTFGPDDPLIESYWSHRLHVGILLCDNKPRVLPDYKSQSPCILRFPTQEQCAINLAFATATHFLYHANDVHPSSIGSAHTLLEAVMDLTGGKSVIFAAFNDIDANLFSHLTRMISYVIKHYVLQLPWTIFIFCAHYVLLLPWKIFIFCAHMQLREWGWLIVLGLFIMIMGAFCVFIVYTRMQLREWKRQIMLGLSITGVFFILLYAPSEAPICKLGLIKGNDFFELCSTQTFPLTARRTDPLERREGWGVSQLAEMVVVAHNNITLSKFELTMLEFIPFATKAGEEMLTQTRLLEDESFDALILVNKFVKTMCDDLDFLLISYYDVDIDNIVFSAELTVSDAGLMMGSSLANAMNLGNVTLKQLEFTIALLNTTYSGLCMELGWRASGYFPWRWWYPRAREHQSALLNVQLRFSDALFDLKKAVTGLNSLLTDMQLLERSSERTDVTKVALAKRNVLKLVGTRLSSLLRTEGEVDIIAMAGAALVGSRRPQVAGSSQPQEVAVVEKAAIRS
ncbi:hypothetical protein BDZ89DRAFT_1143458 [Hymenopellis radicata]|nr:hypothetical protein BDZ89DRAFT_1143458 [Hymenopellis radicata]